MLAPLHRAAPRLPTADEKAIKEATFAGDLTRYQPAALREWYRTMCYATRHARVGRTRTRYASRADALTAELQRRTDAQ